MSYYPKLHAMVYDNDRATFGYSLGTVSNCGIRWSEPGGVQKITISLTRVVDELAQRFWYQQGNWLVVYDTYCDMPIAVGEIRAVYISGKMVYMEAVGEWQKFFDTYERTNPGAATDTGTYLSSTVIPDHVMSGNLDVTNIQTTGISFGSSFEVDTVKGTRPGDIVRAVRDMGTSANEILDFWIQQKKFDGVSLQYPECHLAARATTPTPNWVISLADLRDERIGRDAYDLRDYVQVAYSPSTTLSSGASASASTLALTSTTGFVDGAEIEVVLDNGRKFRTYQTGAPSGSNITTTEGIPSAAASGNAVRCVTPTLSTAISDTQAQTNYFWRAHVHNAPNMNATQAAAAGQAISARFAYPQQRAAFTIGSRWIYDNDGRRWPLWRILTNPGWIRIKDLLLSLDDLDDEGQKVRTFFAGAVDYDYVTNLARVAPADDSRLDVILRNVGAPVGESVSTAV